jgi:hypothetical protein
MYKGIVKRFNDKTSFYRIVYEDGDREDFTLRELKKVRYFQVNSNQNRTISLPFLH